MTTLLKPTDPSGTLAKRKHILTQYYTAARGDTTLAIAIPAPGLDWYYPAPMPSWNTGFYFVSQSQTGCVLGYTNPCPAGGGEVQVTIIH